MGFLLFAASSVAFSVAGVISIVLGVIGIALYIWRGRYSKQTKQFFWYILVGIILMGVLIVNLIPYPQAPAGSNYAELLNEWAIKAVVYALLPGVACLFGGATSLFVHMVLIKEPKGN